MDEIINSKPYKVLVRADDVGRVVDININNIKGSK